jgi:CheY-like chemotaxis protein
MKAIRILHVDDEPDIREIVDLSLGLNPEFEVRSCASGAEAVAIAAEWAPIIILLDVMMPGMDGPSTLAELRKNPASAEIPVLFMTARAQPREVEQFIALGAQGVISKPFDPMTLAFTVRSHLQSARIGKMRGVFLRRAGNDMALLELCRSGLAHGADPAALSQIREIAHSLAGAAGLYGFERISAEAAALEDAVLARLGGGPDRFEGTQALDRLLAEMRREAEAPAAAA